MTAQIHGDCAIVFAEPVELGLEEARAAPHAVHEKDRLTASLLAIVELHAAADIDRIVRHI